MSGSESGLLGTLLLVWGVITTVLVLLLIYRGILTSKEEDQIFLNQAEEHLAREQQELLVRITRLSKPILAFGVISGGMLLSIVGLWVRDVLKRF